MQPSGRPSQQPISYPSGQPSGVPSLQPANYPSMQPSGRPSQQPLNNPSGQPSSCPSKKPKIEPSTQPLSTPYACPVNFGGIQTNQPSNLFNVFQVNYQFITIQLFIVLQVNLPQCHQISVKKNGELLNNSINNQFIKDYLALAISLPVAAVFVLFMILFAYYQSTSSVKKENKEGESSSIKKPENKPQESHDLGEDLLDFYPNQIGIYELNETDPDINEILKKMKDENKSSITKMINLFYPNKRILKAQPVFTQIG